ncbi:Protease-associated domain, PA [Cynara cardunculus var. scolymus]|uniref:Protease-associated domain, PA n=1 Tax=Cynara cardunculus var. scolymus TaxID=59895 RepID=A0A103XBX4_CYNCS|nr:Protease-associated domain, PA [Cynara cardunculus var. scolymus]
MLNHCVFCSFLCLMASGAIANVVLMGNNVTLSFDDIEANFAPPLKGSGECGTLFLAEPLDACAPLTNSSIADSINPFVLMVRGGCGFEDKVRRAQSAGFKAAIVYNSDDSDLVSKRPQASRVREFHGMSSRLVKAMPSLIFTAVLEDNCTSATCAICLEDYNVGDRLRILPCRHKFHAICVDAWLTSWRTFCPVCKRDARTSTGDPPASERTPLLSASVASSTILSSTYSSSYASSRAIQIGQASPHTGSNIHSVSSSTRYNLQSLQSPYLSPTRSSLDIRNASSHRSCASHLISSNSLGYPSLSPLNSRHMSSYYPSPVNASSSFMWSSSQQPHPLRHADSAASFSPFASAQSLPEC